MDSITIHTIQQVRRRDGSRYAVLNTDAGQFRDEQIENRTDLRQLAAEILDANGINLTPDWDCQLPAWATLS